MSLRKLSINDIANLEPLNGTPPDTQLRLLWRPDGNLPLASVWGVIDVGAEVSCSIESHGEVIYVVEGSLEITGPNEKLILHSGEILFVPATGNKSDKVTYKALDKTRAFSIECAKI